MKLFHHPLRALQLLREKGARLVFANFKERILFDFFNRVDTITQIQKEAFDFSSPNLDHALHYSSSWTSEIIFGFNTARSYLGDDFDKYVMVDIGCGRGKVSIKWEQMLRKKHIIQRVVGVDYYAPLIIAAEANFERVLGKKGIFFCADATQFDFSVLGHHIILYLYNPFDEYILMQMLSNLIPFTVVLIYNNPVHMDAAIHAGFRLIKEKRGFHPQGHTALLARPAI